MKSLSVVIPVYNAEKFIEATLESVVRQTHLPDEIIIVNDGSTDSSLKLIQSFFDKNRFENFKIISVENGGHSKASNLGAKEARGELLAFLDSDDLWADEKLAKSLGLFERDRDLKLVFSKFHFIDEVGKICSKQTKRQSFVPENLWERLLVEGNLIYGSNSGVVIDRKAFADISGYDEELLACEDWDLWIRLARQYKFGFIDEYLTQVRVHANNQSSDKMLMLDYQLNVIEKHMYEIGLSNVNLSEVLGGAISLLGPNVLGFYCSPLFNGHRDRCQKISREENFLLNSFFPVLRKVISRYVANI